MKNKILYIGNFAFPDGNASGARVLGNGYLLKKLGLEVSFIGLENKLSHNSNLEKTEKKFDSFLHYSLPYPVGIKGWLAYKKRFNEVSVLIKKQNVKAIILYGSPTISLFGRLIRKWCNKNNVILIVDVVDWLSAGSGSPFYRAVKYIDTTYQKRILNASADGLITVSTYLSNYYNRKGCKTVIIPPLVSPLKYKNLVKTYEQHNVKKLIYVGQPFPTDGRIVKKASFKDRLDKVISILYELKEEMFIFNIFGLTKEQYLKVIYWHKEMLEILKEKVIFHGYIKNSDAIIRISEADFTVLFRDNNRMTKAGFPTKFVESISCGTPIITTKTSDLADYLENGKNGFFVNINNVNKLTIRMKEILQLDKENLVDMKKHCIENPKFSYSNFEDEMRTFLEELNLKLD